MVEKMVNSSTKVSAENGSREAFALENTLCNFECEKEEGESGMCRVVCVEPQKMDMTGTKDGKCVRKAPMAVDLLTVPKAFWMSVAMNSL